VQVVLSVHDLHIWTMHGDRVSLSAHVVITEATAWPELLARCQRMLIERFEIDHVTLQPSWITPPAGRKVIALAVRDENKERHLH
jgi:cobalt-zinc-cadmium efflux system protein